MCASNLLVEVATYSGHNFFCVCRAKNNNTELQEVSIFFMEVERMLIIIRKFH